MTESHQEPRVFKEGDEFPPHYLVERFLDEGTAGQVYVVRHRFTERRCALKVCHPKDVGVAKVVARGLKEGRAGHAIQHRNVCPVIDLAVESSGLVWILMELLAGSSVADLLKRFGRVPPLMAIDICLEAAAGLQAAHEVGIIHRDVHPGNIFVCEDGTVKVLDFSIAKDLTSPVATTMGAPPAGSAAYRATEGFMQAATPTVLWDVASLGITFWQMLVGRHPWAQALDNVFRMTALRFTEDPPSLVTAVGLPAYFDDVVLRATARDPQQRIQGMWPLTRALVELRERFAADLAADRIVFDTPVWEGGCAIVRDPVGAQQYSAPRSLPGTELPPALPSRRVVVAPEVPVAPVAPEAPVATRGVGATVKMAAFENVPAPHPPVAVTLVPQMQALPPADVAAPTVRGQARASSPEPPRPPRPSRPSRGMWALLAVPPVLVVAGAGVWALTRADAPTEAPAASAAPAAPRSAAAAPKTLPSAAPSVAAAPSPSPGPRRPSPPRPAH